MAVEAVLFDYSGVLTSSAFTHMGDLGADRGIPPEEMLELLLGPYHEDTDHPWHRCERGELGVLEWVTEIMRLAEERGWEIDLTRLKDLLDQLDVNERVVDKVRDLRARGYRLAVVTNTIKEASDRWRTIVPIDELFDVVIDSSEVGMRKPDPRIYALALDRLGGIPPERAVFLDDAPGNVDGARRAGLQAMLVGPDPDDALAELEALLAS
jgi:epoxide hydrolase-like predicted phosphatase